MATISEALSMAVQHHQAGRLQAAEQIYRQVLQVQPDQADAWHLLGLPAHPVGQNEAAARHIPTKWVCLAVLRAWKPPLEERGGPG